MKTIRIFSLREKSWQPKKVREKRARLSDLQAKLAYAQSMGDKPVKKKIEELNRLADIIKISRRLWNTCRRIIRAVEGRRNLSDYTEFHGRRDEHS